LVSAAAAAATWVQRVHVRCVDRTRRARRRRPARYQIASQQQQQQPQQPRCTAPPCWARAAAAAAAPINHVSHRPLPARARSLVTISPAASASTISREFYALFCR